MQGLEIAFNVQDNAKETPKSIQLTNLAVFTFPAFKALTLNTFIFFICSAVTIVITRVG